MKLYNWTEHDYNNEYAVIANSEEEAKWYILLYVLNKECESFRRFGLENLTSDSFSFDVYDVGEVLQTEVC